MRDIGTVMKRSSTESRARLFAIAESQSGFFTAKQAEEAGYARPHHVYHVQAGNWQRVERAIYHLVLFPMPDRPDLVLWSLWSRNKTEDAVQGVYSHQTALSLYDLSDIMPAKLHMTVPPKFRRSRPAPPILTLHYADLAPDQIEEREGYRITKPLRTILDIRTHASPDIFFQALAEARGRGLITQREVEMHAEDLEPFIHPSGTPRVTVWPLSAPTDI